MNHQILKAVIYDAHETIRSLEIVTRDYHFVEYVNLNYSPRCGASG